jgi:hypothetical protein
MKGIKKYFEFIKESEGLPEIIDANFFASFGNPSGFRESKILGESSDYYEKTKKFKETEFSFVYSIISRGLKKLTMHFESLEPSGFRRGGHSGMGFVFSPSTPINNSLIERLLPYVEKYRKDNFIKDGEKWRIKTNNPREIRAFIPK